MRWNVKRKTGQICPKCEEKGIDSSGNRCYLCGGFGRINSKEDWTGFAGYEIYKDSLEFALIKQGIHSLVKNQDLELKTSIDRVAGYLVKSLKEGDKFDPKTV